MEKKGILGRKIGMTQVFTKKGRLIPVTVIEVTPNIVTQIKTVESDGYNAVQLGFKDIREKIATKASIGHTNKANTTPKRFFKEISGVDVKNYSLGQEIKADVFVEGEIVDVTGISKGKGFQGVIKRHGQHRGPMGHGSHYHRGPGSMGTMRPMRVFKGKKLPGHMGVETVTIQNLEIVKIDLENNIILVTGNVPGPKQSLVIIKTAVKNPNKINTAEELVSYTNEEPINTETVPLEETEIQTSEEVSEETEIQTDLEILEENVEVSEESEENTETEVSEASEN